MTIGIFFAVLIVSNGPIWIAINMLHSFNDRHNRRSKPDFWFSMTAPSKVFFFSIFAVQNFFRHIIPTNFLGFCFVQHFQKLLIISMATMAIHQYFAIVSLFSIKMMSVNTITFTKRTSSLQLPIINRNIFKLRVKICHC